MLKTSWKEFFGKVEKKLVSAASISSQALTQSVKSGSIFSSTTDESTITLKTTNLATSYENSWNFIQDSNKELTIKAALADKQVDTAYRISKNYYDDWTSLHFELSGLDQLITHIQNLNKDLENVVKKIDEVEKKYGEIVEEQAAENLHNRKMQAIEDAKKYEYKKLEELKLFEQQLYKQEVKAIEEEREIKQNVLQTHLQEDLNNFREHGVLDSTKKEYIGPPIEEVAIPVTDNLDDFYSDVKLDDGSKGKGKITMVEEDDSENVVVSKEVDTPNILK